MTQFQIDAEAGLDANLDTREHTRGFAFINSDLIGRYWRVGPQQTLYVPSPLLGDGRHTATLVATDGQGGGLTLAERPILDELQGTD